MKRQHAFLACGIACLAISFCFFVHAYIVVPLTARSAQTTTAATPPTPHQANTTVSLPRAAKPVRSKKRAAEKLTKAEPEKRAGEAPPPHQTPVLRQKSIQRVFSHLSSGCLPFIAVMQPAYL